ncbi:MAG: DNA polymerase II large subunit [Candidatus Thermoplasmatota archaeon]|nr:DNA polymerase II large subunit [Candidatus Thermoplasmatota archaeon]
MQLEVEPYFSLLKKQASFEYELAERARAKGKDNKEVVEIPQAEDLAGRVEALTQVRVSDKIRELSKMHDRENVAIQTALFVAENTEGSREEKIEKAVRVALAILTEGILVAPLEGISAVKVLERNGGDFLAIYYSGPIRSAGGTAQAMSVLVGDLLRRRMGIGKYTPTDDEVERYKEEIPLYARVQHLQYVPTLEEIEITVRGSPVCITGEGTEDSEVSGHRDLPLVETNRIRGGMALVIAEGLILKASKLKKYVKNLNMEGWNFTSEKTQGRDVSANYNFLKEIVAGRPALSYPSRKGGFRLRYGRSRNTGLAAIAINPVTMKTLDDFIAVGTQVKIERPGKAGAIVANDNIEGPTVLLKDGSLVSLKTFEDYDRVRDYISEIVDLGEILISFGDFIENNKTVFPGAFTTGWWEKIANQKIGEVPVIAGEEDAIRLSMEKRIPLHPSYTLLWHDTDLESIRNVSLMIQEEGRVENGRLLLPRNDKIKSFLEDVLCEHVCEGGLIIDRYLSLIVPMGLRVEDGKIVRKKELEDGDLFESLSKAATFPIYPRGPSRIGARMGRPEKAEERKMSPPVHALFPIGNVLKNQRNLNKYVQLTGAEMQSRRCPSCGTDTYDNICPNCRTHTVASGETRKYDIDLSDLLADKARILNVKIPEKFNGVKGLLSANKTPEPIEKGMLRAVHSVFPFKDGTCRFDMSDLPVTSFKPNEIGLSVEKAKLLGYVVDHYGHPLENGDQVVELFPQDVIPSKKGGTYLLRVSQFTDDLLSKFYGLEKYYMAESREDLIGELIIGLAPHTSGGVLGRIIGFTDADVGYAHPFYHAAKRRNCDGDEDSIMLLLDGLLNFSRDFLPSTRGSQMDAPLVLSLKINPLEIDKEALNLDITGDYPIELLEMTRNYPSPSEISKYVVTVAERIKKGELYPLCRFTDDVSSINLGTLNSNYKYIESMEKKLEMQLELGRKLRSVDVSDMAERILKYHFIPDIMGNLNKFGSQTFRCTSCNTIYRRPPLSGKCTKCGTNLIGTVHKGNITKYLEFSYKISNDFQVSDYIRQRISILRDSVNSIFIENNNFHENLEIENDDMKSDSGNERNLTHKTLEDFNDS